MSEKELNTLRYKILLIIDAIIEKEGAFGMAFAGHEFEARYKCGNECAYERKQPFGEWTFQECLDLLDSIKNYELYTEDNE